QNDRRLTDQQIQTIATWADGGAPEGSGPLTAKAPPSNDGWSHPSGRPPDLIVEMAEPYEGKATGELPWFNIYQELPAELKKNAGRDVRQPSSTTAATFQGRHSSSIRLEGTCGFQRTECSSGVSTTR